MKEFGQDISGRPGNAGKTLTRRTMMGMMASATCLPFAGCGKLPSETLRYRMTLTVEADGKPVQGATVIEVSLGRSVGMPYAMSKRGEALVVDLGQRGLLFAVLVGATGDQGYWEMLPERVIAPALGVHPNVTRDDDDRIGIFKRLLDRPRGEKVELPFDKLPLLIHFRDINHPDSVEAVDPKDLGKTFGPGLS